MGGLNAVPACSPAFGHCYCAQIAPRSLPAMLRDPQAAERVVAAFMGMGKHDIAALERAHAGADAG